MDTNKFYSCSYVLPNNNISEYMSFCFSHVSNIWFWALLMKINPFNFSNAYFQNFHFSFLILYESNLSKRKSLTNMNGCNIWHLIMICIDCKYKYLKQIKKNKMQWYAISSELDTAFILETQSSFRNDKFVSFNSL